MSSRPLKNRVVIGVRLITLIETALSLRKVLQIQGEYWYTSDRELLDATDGGEYDHEGHVMSRVLSIVTDALGVENKYDIDVAWFRTDMGDLGGAEPDKLALELQRHHSEDEVQCILSLISGGSNVDARQLAIDYWGWVRISGPIS